MKQQNFFDFINVDGFSSTPKYMQLANSIQEAVFTGKIDKNRLLPSLHELTYHLEISKETADKGYKYLRSLGILSSVPGKGHYITANNIARSHRIFLLINKLSSNKKVFYDAFTKALGEPVIIDFYVYNDDYLLFKKLITSRREGYSNYVILPNFADGGEGANELINTIPKDKLIVLDKHMNEMSGEHGVVYQNFKKDIYVSLEKALERLARYDSIKLVLPKCGYYPLELVQGFNLFCQQYAFERKVIKGVGTEEINKGEVFICLNDDELINLIERVKDTKLVVGKHIGIISYNETPLKKYILNGITTISTDFEQMGAKAAAMILENNMEKMELDCHLNIRASL